VHRGPEEISLGTRAAQFVPKSGYLVVEPAQARIRLAGPGAELFCFEPPAFDLDAKLANLGQQPLDDVLIRLRPRLAA
jgi:hypothetical protein